MRQSVEDRLTRAKIQIQKKNSFFAYLSLYIRFKKADKQLPPWAGAGINLKGRLLYREDWINKLDDNQIQGVLLHEIMHLALLHLPRLKSRNREVWNLACDLCVNEFVYENGFTLPKGCLKADDDDKFNLFGVTIKDISDKNAELIYDELIKKLPKCNCSQADLEEQGFDYHSATIDGEGEGNDEQQLTKTEMEKISKDWERKLNEAVTVAKMRGDLPAGIQRFVDDLHKEQIDWRGLLQRHMMNMLPYNFSWRLPHKKSRSVGTYMPNVEKEKIDVVVGIDVSGSIGKEELTDFLSEIIGMARTFSERIDMRLITHECDVVNDWEVKNGNIEKIKKLNLRGGGGTAHKPLFNYIKKKIPLAKCGIFLTDGWSDLQNINFDKYLFDKIIVISKHGDENCVKDKPCVTIKLEDTKNETE